VADRHSFVAVDRHPFLVRRDRDHRCYIHDSKGMSTAYGFLHRVATDRRGLLVLRSPNSDRGVVAFRVWFRSLSARCPPVDGPPRSPPRWRAVSRPDLGDSAAIREPGTNPRTRSNADRALVSFGRG
jgi:hypothetical protein